MLTPLQPGEFDRYLAFAWALAQKPAHCSYPIYTDGIHTKEDFCACARRVRDDANAEILLFCSGGAVEGWLQLYWLREERYLSLDACCVRRGAAQALAELLALAGARFPGFLLTLSFPDANTEAAGFLAAQGFLCVERTCHNTFDLRQNAPPPSRPLRRVTAETFADFRRLHAPYEAEMYWTSDRLLQRLGDWHILLLDAPPEAGGRTQPAGAVYFTGAGRALEIFGLDFAHKRFDDGVCRALLAGALAEARRLGAPHLLFLCEEACQPAARALGFSCAGRCLCWQKQL